MPETKYERDTHRLDCTGVDLNRPVDSVKQNKFPLLKNVRSYTAGQIEPRFGLTDIAQVVAGQTPVHSCRRLNDPANSTFTRVVGAGTHLAYGQGSFTDLDSGYSGDPLALVPWKPDASPAAFMYVADRSRMRKVSSAGALHTIGLPEPATAPAVGLTTVPLYKEIDSFQATTGWTQGGTAGAPSTTSRVNTTISKIVYDTGTTGWASVSPVASVGIGPGMRMIVAAAETFTVQAVYPGTASTTVASVIYDSGTTGLASVVLATSFPEAAADVLVLNTGAANETVRIVAAIPGPDGSISLRVSTTGTWVAGDNVQVLPTFRAYFTGTRAATNTLTESALRTAVTTGTGTLTKTAALDLTIVGSTVSAKPEDLMHVSLRVSDQTLLTELKVQLDVDSSVNTFTQNFYTYSMRASDLTPSVSNLQSLLATRQDLMERIIVDTPVSPYKGVPNEFEPSKPIIQRAVDYFNTQKATVASEQTTLAQINSAISAQLDSGASQFVEITFPLSSLVRVGTDKSRSLANVATVQLVVLATGSINVDICAWWIGGGYGPNSYSVTASPYFYRYRARNPATNVASNFSPATRYPVLANRQSVTVSPTQYAAPSGTSLSTTDFVIDIDRFGGEVPDWHYVGTIANAASPSFADIYPDDVVVGQPIQSNNNAQPWPIIGTPVTGTTGTVSGTTINDSGTTFNTSWAQGTLILVNNQPYHIYRVISTSRLEIVENAGSQTSVVWRIDQPTILAQPLPCLWESNNIFFACGDSTNPGRLYYSNPNSETTTSTNYLDVTSPSEPLMNGLEYNIRVYVFSSDNFIQILPNNDPQHPYISQIIPNGKGLFARWALTREPAPAISFLGKDGIYITTGGSPKSLTDDDLYPLFPNEGNLGNHTNGVAAPNIVSAQAANLRLCYYDEFLYFDYAAVSGGAVSQATLVLAFDLGQGGTSWFWDNYTPTAQFHYGEEGSGVHSLLVGTTSSTHLYQYSGVSDAGSAFTIAITMPSTDQGDPRQNKLYGDIMLDANTASVTVTATPTFNNAATSGTPVSVTTASRLQTPIPTSSAWNTARNIGLTLTASVSTSSRPIFYIWEPRWTFESAPISALSWEISPTTFGMEDFKHFGLCKVTHVSTVDLSLIVTIDGVAQPTLTITNSGGAYVQTVFRVPVYKAKLYKIRLATSDGTTPFRLDPRDSFFQVKNWGSDSPYSELRLFSDYAMVQG
jgi:hypothetical protein